MYLPYCKIIFPPKKHFYNYFHIYLFFVVCCIWKGQQFFYDCSLKVFSMSVYKKFFLWVFIKAISMSVRPKDF